jgi:hypothetical protein
MVVAELTFQGPVVGHESKTWSANMRTPSVPASMLQSCSIIDLTYKLIVSCLQCGKMPLENIMYIFFYRIFSNLIRTFFTVLEV